MKINDVLDIYNELDNEAGKESCFICSSYYERKWGDILRVTSTIHNCAGKYSRQVIQVCNNFKCPIGKESDFVEQNERLILKVFIKERND